MKGLKFLAACAAVGAVSVACAAASFAAEWATYVPATESEPGKATITIPADYVTAVGSGDFTLLILNKDEPNITEQNKECVIQIQQGAAADIATVTVGDLKDGEYYVRVGGADVSAENPNGYVATTMTVGGDDDIVYGDVDASGEPGVSDTTLIFKALNGTITLTEKQSKAADVDASGEPGVSDTTLIFKYLNGQLASFPAESK